MAHEIGKQAVIKSAHFDLLTPRVSRLGNVRSVHQRTILINVIR